MIEIEITTYTAAADYLPYRVPEGWLLQTKGLKMYTLTEAGYQPIENSQFFPKIKLPELTERILQAAAGLGSGLAIRELRRTLL